MEDEDELQEDVAAEEVEEDEDEEKKHQEEDDGDSSGNLGPPSVCTVPCISRSEVCSLSALTGRQRRLLSRRWWDDGVRAPLSLHTLLARVLQIVNATVQVLVELPTQCKHS